MDLDFYLSEMSVSDHHGGGLTLQRIIGADLLKIPHFAHVSRFANELPATEKFRSRSINLESPWNTNTVRKVIGSTIASGISKKLFMVKQHAQIAAAKLNKQLGRNRKVSALVCPQSPASLYTLEALKRYREVSYITWVMDDHIVKFIDGEWCYPGDTGLVFEKHLKEAEHVFVISPAMQDFYRSRFGVESTVLFGSSDPDGQVARSAVKQSSALKIGYFGAVSAWQTDALQLFAEAVKDSGTQLHIYSGIHELPAALSLNGIYLMGRLDPDMVLPTMRNYDAVILPISFLEKMRSMSEFNIATKMSEYLASGVPIIAVGPPYAAMIKYLREHDAAIIVEEDKQADINFALETLRNEARVAELLANAQKLVETETGTIPMRKRWAEVVNG